MDIDQLQGSIVELHKEVKRINQKIMKAKAGKTILDWMHYRDMVNGKIRVFRRELVAKLFDPKYVLTSIGGRVISEPLTLEQFYNLVRKGRKIG